MALELKYASDATLLLDDLVDSLGSPGNAAGVVVPVLMPSLPLVDRTKPSLADPSRTASVGDGLVAAAGNGSPQYRVTRRSLAGRQGRDVR